jgi:hypothetical protein
MQEVRRTEMKRLWMVAGLLLLAGCATWVAVGGPYESTSGRFAVELPQGWMRLNTGEYVLITRDGLMLQNIRIQRYLVDQPLQHTKKSFEKGMLPQEIAEVIVDDLSGTPQMLNFEVVENVPVDIGGNPGFRIVFTHNNKDGLKFRSVFCGFMKHEWVYNIQYSAAQRHYFEKDMETFQDVVVSFRLT